VRNPWDRIVSEYKYRGYPVKIDFKTYLFKHLPLDFVGRYESLQADFDKVCARLGIPPTPPAPGEPLAG
jgi:hypothetical protein